ARHLPAITKVPAELPLAAGQQLVLDGVVDRRGVAEHELRQLVVEIRRSGSVQHRLTVEGEGTTRPVEDLRLPVVELRAYHVEAEAHVMRASDVADIDRAGKAAVVAGDRRPSSLLANRREAEVEPREAALPQVRPVSPRDAQDFGPDIFAEVHSLRRLVHSGI